MGRAVIVQSLLIKTYADSPFPISRLELLPPFETSRNLNITALRTEMFRQLYGKNSNPYNLIQVLPQTLNNILFICKLLRKFSRVGSVWMLNFFKGVN